MSDRSPRIPPLAPENFSDEQKALVGDFEIPVEGDAKIFEELSKIRHYT